MAEAPVVPIAVGGVKILVPADAEVLVKMGVEDLHVKKDVKIPVILHVKKDVKLLASGDVNITVLEHVKMVV